MFDADAVDELSAAAQSEGLDPAVLLAIAEVESGGRAYAEIAGRREPVIRFEGHYFDARLSAENRRLARARGLASPAPGGVARRDRRRAGHWSNVRRRSTPRRPMSRCRGDWDR